MPCRGSAPGLKHLTAGATESPIDPLATNIGKLRGGTLRALAVATARWMSALPDVPSFGESGLPRLTAGVWIGLSGPRGLPAPMTERIAAEIPKILGRPDLRQRFEELASYARYAAAARRGVRALRGGVRKALDDGGAAGEHRGVLSLKYRTNSTSLRYFRTYAGV